MRQKYVYAAWFALHFLLITAFSCRETLRLIAEGPTIVPSSLHAVSRQTESAAGAILGQGLAGSNPIRQILATYLALAGVEAGYGYFAPNVPASYKLVFELHYSDGRVEYELPSVSSEAAGFRVAGLLDNIGRTRYDLLREILVKTLAQSVWRTHPDVQSVRAIVGRVRLPTLRAFEEGQRKSYEFLYAYDFSLNHEPGNARDR